MTTRKDDKLSWIVEIKNLAKDSFSMAELAEELGVNRATVHRYLDGTHDPQPKTIEKVNRAVAAMVAPSFPITPLWPGFDLRGLVRKSVKQYLDAVACADYGGFEDIWEDPTWGGIELGLFACDQYLSAGGHGKIVQCLKRDSAVEEQKHVPLSDRRVTKLGRALLTEWHAFMLDNLRAGQRRKTRLDRFLSVFRKYGLPIERYLKPESELSPVLAFERFEVAVSSAIAEQVPDRDAAAKILSCTFEAAWKLVQDRTPTRKGKKP